MREPIHVHGVDGVQLSLGLLEARPVFEAGDHFQIVAVAPRVGLFFFGEGEGGPEAGFGREKIKAFRQDADDLEGPAIQANFTADGLLPAAEELLPEAVGENYFRFVPELPVGLFEEPPEEGFLVE